MIIHSHHPDHDALCHASILCISIKSWRYIEYTTNKYWYFHFLMCLHDTDGGGDQTHLKLDSVRHGSFQIETDR